MNEELSPNNLIAPSNNYDDHTNEYIQLTESDPSKKWVQYPQSMRMVFDAMGGELKDKKILDIGCANGAFTRMMAEAGAKVVGYDPSQKEVEEAQKMENEKPLGIQYYVGDHLKDELKNKFDGATAILVLSLMENREKLEQIFRHAHDSLVPDGKFIILTINPEFNKFNEIIYNRRFNKIGNGKEFTLDFFDNDKNLKFTISGWQYSREDHQQAALNAGFKNIEWQSLKIDPRGLAEQGEKFWEGYETEDGCPYIGLIANK